MAEVTEIAAPDAATVVAPPLSSAQAALLTPLLDSLVPVADKSAAMRYFREKISAEHEDPNEYQATELFGSLLSHIRSARSVSTPQQVSLKVWAVAEPELGAGHNLMLFLAYAPIVATVLACCKVDATIYFGRYTPSLTRSGNSGESPVLQLFGIEYP
ncbi:MAG TPA: hypothetical protein VH349_16565 [Ktedonobacterales bacterium]|jgi:hypothetical protein